jgi:hypothetical protein
MEKMTQEIHSRNSTTMPINDPCQSVESMMRWFTLTPGRWYAAEMIGDEFSPGLRHYSPIRVDAVSPKDSAWRVFDLWFYHANYPPGVRTKMYTLQMLDRGERFLLAKSLYHTPSRFLLVSEITGEWLREHFRLELPDKSDVGTWLNRHA